MLCTFNAVTWQILLTAKAVSLIVVLFIENDILLPIISIFQLHSVLRILQYTENRLSCLINYQYDEILLFHVCELLANEKSFVSVLVMYLVFVIAAMSSYSDMMSLDWYRKPM